MEVLGIDIGGTGTKGGLVNIETGEMVSERFRLDTPRPAMPEAVAEKASEIVKHFNYSGPVGCGFPAIVKNGVALSAANIDKSWIGTDAASLIADKSGCEVYVCNDADLAGIAEMEYGAGKGREGVVLLITIGTGLGSALFVDGQLVPNTEFGHFYLPGMEEVVEKYAAASVKKGEGLTWEEWSVRFNQYIKLLRRLFSPDLLILGGGGSKRFDKYKQFLPQDIEILPAQMLNNAGIIGAAVFAHKMKK